MTSENSLSLHWAFGFTKDNVSSVHSLCSKDSNMLLYVSSHSAVLYNFEYRTQTILQGHSNIISCSAVDKTKRWVVTADAGDESVMIVWDTSTAVPVKTFFNPHPRGVHKLDLSDDGLYIVTISNPIDGEQEIAVWAWTKDEETPLVVATVPDGEIYKAVSFSKEDPHDIVATSNENVTTWCWDELELENYMGVISRNDVGIFTGDFTASLLVPGTDNMFSATSDGYVLVWESQQNKSNVNGRKVVKVATKSLRLVQCSINILTYVENEYVIAGCGDGGIRFYDKYLRLEAWFEDLNAGPVMALSFSIQANPFHPGEAGKPGLKFWVPDFIVATSEAFVVGVESSLFDEIRKEDRCGTLLMQGMNDSVVAVAAHPEQELVSIICSNGSLQVWNYGMKLLMILRDFNISSSANSFDKKKTATLTSKSQPTCMAYSKNGTLIAIGFSSGVIKVILAETLEDAQTFSPSTDSVKEIIFSPNGDYLAASSTEHHVLLFKLEQKKAQNYIYIGRSLSHTAPIVGLQFGYNDIKETLISISEDRFCLEYDLQETSMTRGLVIVSSEEKSSCLPAGRLELSARPAAAMWLPSIEGEAEEDKFIVTNDEFKIKEFNLQSKKCRKTALAPCFGSPASILKHIPHEEGDRASYAYSTGDRIVGIGLIPFTGSPSEVMGLIGHPKEITSISVSCDGKYLFTGGGSDLSVNMWEIERIKNNTENNEEMEMTPFYDLLEGGKGGELHEDIMDYFYYCQLKLNNSMKSMNLVPAIPVEDIPSMVRAIGYYPSEEEVESMVNEVKYKNFTSTGEIEEVIKLNDFIKLYLNYRPVLPLDKQNIVGAFETIKNTIHPSGIAGHLDWKTIVDSLVYGGEKIDAEKLNELCKLLVGSDVKAINSSTAFDAKMFAEEILGFDAV